jgi:hypothetical protein
LLKAITAKEAETTPPDTPRITGESQYSTSIELAVRPSPERAQPIFSLFPKDEDTPPPAPPPSTALPQLQAQQEEAREQGRGKRKCVATIGYKEAREQGLMGSLGHSQTQHHA